MAKSEFETIAELIREADHPFPVVQARRLILRATARTSANEELAAGIDQLNATLGALANLIEEIGGGHNHTRYDALADLWALRNTCEKASARN